MPGRTTINIFSLYRGQLGLSSDGTFKEDPWFIVGGNEILEMGFGKAPPEFSANILAEGVVMPALVNAHTHLELSAYKGKLEGGEGVHGMAGEFAALHGSIAREQVFSAAIEDLKYAISRGTFFFNDIANDPEFSEFLRGSVYFEGNRFLEILGFSSEKSQERMNIAEKALEQDTGIIPTPHSVYGSSPLIMNFVREHARQSTMSIHLLESEDERGLPFERGATYRFLKKIDQYQRYPEIYASDLIEYLSKASMFSFRKLFLIHLAYARTADISAIAQAVPHAAWVLTQRSNQFLGIRRTNLQELLHSPLIFLLGTDSSATGGDVSILDEMAALAEQDLIAEESIFRAATSDAYEYLDIHPSRIPWFLFPGAEGNIESISKVKKALMLRA